MTCPSADPRFENAALVFKEMGVEYDRIGDPNRWVVDVDDELILFWPATNKWKPIEGHKVYSARGPADVVSKVRHHQQRYRRELQARFEARKQQYRR